MADLIMSESVTELIRNQGNEMATETRHTTTKKIKSKTDSAKEFLIPDENDKENHRTMSSKVIRRETRHANQGGSNDMVALEQPTKIRCSDSEKHSSTNLSDSKEGLWSL